MLHYTLYVKAILLMYIQELKQQLNKSVSTLTKSIALLDKDTQLQQKDFTKVLQAEIEIRYYWLCMCTSISDVVIVLVVYVTLNF